MNSARLRFTRGQMAVPSFPHLMRTEFLYVQAITVIWINKKFLCQPSKSPRNNNVCNALSFFDRVRPDVKSI